MWEYRTKSDLVFHVQNLKSHSTNTYETNSDDSIYYSTDSKEILQGSVWKAKEVAPEIRLVKCKMLFLTSNN